MGHSQTEKARNRERILTQAAAEIRNTGFASVSVAKLMRSVDLTHGGFYGHFQSRDELLARALERALADGESASRAGADPERPRTYAGIVRNYLSRKHRDSRASGCAVAALASDVARAGPELRAVMSERIESFAGKTADSMLTPDQDRALFAVSAMIGALLVSRVLDDPKRSDAVLRAARAHLLALDTSLPATSPPQPSA